VAKKTKRWRQVRQQQRREKSRLYKMSKPVRETSGAIRLTEDEQTMLGAVGEMIRSALGGWMNRKPDIDRRTMNRTGKEKGDR
jgi:hypothetical protein